MLKVFINFAFTKIMLAKLETPHWPSLLQPLADASKALGHLAFALQSTALHQGWLWRETALGSAKICQIAGHRIRAERLMSNLSGIPLDPAADDTGLAAARRVFLTATPLFRAAPRADSKNTDQAPFAPLWNGEALRAGDMAEEEQGRGDRDRLLALAHELADQAGLAARPVLLDLLLNLRRHARAGRLPPSLMRLALPLALHRTALIPRAAPALLGGRLPLGMTRASGDAVPVTPWLARALSALAEEADGAVRRLIELADQHRAWHVRLADAGLRRHARAPAILDLLAATPVLSASLAARHLSCSPQGAGAMLRRLAALGIVTEATVRSRWKIYLAGDLAPPDHAAADDRRPLAFSEPLPAIDGMAIAETLDGLLRDLDRLDMRARSALAEDWGAKA